MKQWDDGINFFKGLFWGVTISFGMVLVFILGLFYLMR
jgi:hypothetical protein